MEKLRIGVLGAARITPMALLAPAAKLAEVEVVAVAARDRRRAEAFARKHGIPTVHESYDALLAATDIDAVYIPLPNSLHCPWMLEALAAGKHVLCEKPFTSNADEAAEVEHAARRAGRVVMEAFHYRYHPLAERMRAIVLSGELGTIRHIETWMCVPLPLPRDIRYRYELAGGAAMDVGSYAIHMLRLLAGEEPSVISARAWLMSPDVDRAMTAEVSLPSGASGRVNCSLLSSSILRIGVHVKGDDGELRVFNPIMPQLYHRLTVHSGTRKRREKHRGDASYTCQLRAFASAALHGTPVLTPPADAVANMRVIDAVYRAAGLTPRGA